MTTKMTDAMKEAAVKAHEAYIDRLGKKLAKKMRGHVHINLRENLPMKLLSEEFEKSAREQASQSRTDKS